jgi:hypothetical protein
MRKNPERMAWTVLGTAFVVSCILAVTIPLGIRSFLFNTTDEQEAQLSVIEGTILVQKPDVGEPFGVTESATLASGDVVLTDHASRGTLDLFDRSHVTVYGDTSIELERMEAPRFDLSPEANEIALNLTGGLVRVGVALPRDRDTTFKVLTPHTSLELQEGSYRFNVSNQATEITVVRGQALVSLPTRRLLLPQGTRTRVDLDSESTAPLPATQNLIENGDFSLPLSNSWLTSTLVLDPAVPPPAWEVVENGGRQAVRLVRRVGDEGNHTEVAIQQRLDNNVRDFSRLEVALDVLLDYQDLPGGGLLSSEFPVIVRLDYEDIWGDDKFWTHGFYYQNVANYPIAPDPWGRPSGEQIPQGVWYPYESGNLLDLLGDNAPARITSLTVYASGWNYDSLISEVQLIVE